MKLILVFAAITICLVLAVALTNSGGNGKGEFPEKLSTFEIILPSNISISPSGDLISK